jgi:hypothetical protein
LFSRSTDGGKTFSPPIAVNSLTGGPSAVIGADPFVGPDGEVYVPWHDVQNSRLMVASSFDGGATFGQPVTIAPATNRRRDLQRHADSEIRSRRHWRERR